MGPGATMSPGNGGPRRNVESRQRWAPAQVHAWRPREPSTACWAAAPRRGHAEADQKPAASGRAGAAEFTSDCGEQHRVNRYPRRRGRRLNGCRECIRAGAPNKGLLAFEHCSGELAPFVHWWRRLPRHEPDVSHLRETCHPCARSDLSPVCPVRLVTVVPAPCDQTLRAARIFWRNATHSARLSSKRNAQHAHLLANSSDFS